MKAGNETIKSRTNFNHSLQHTDFVFHTFKLGIIFSNLSIVFYQRVGPLPCPFES